MSFLFLFCFFLLHPLSFLHISIWGTTGQGVSTGSPSYELGSYRSRNCIPEAWGGGKQGSRAKRWVPSTAASKPREIPLKSGEPPSCNADLQLTQQGVMQDFPGKQISSPKCSRVCQEERSCLCVSADALCSPRLKPFSPSYCEVGDS